MQNYNFTRNVLTWLILKASVLLCLCLAAYLYTPQTHAQGYGGGGSGSSGSGQSSSRSRKTRKAPAMSESTYNKLTEAQEFIEAGNHKRGLALLHKLEQSKLSDYERAQVYNYFAYTYFTMERYADAIRSYERVLQQPDLPEALEINSIYTLAQLYFIQENYQKAILTINKWFELAEKPTENAYMLLGQAYYQLEKYKQSLVPLQKAYKLTTSRGEKPSETLLLLLRVDYFNLNDYKNMLKVLKELTELYPKTEYWLTMAGAYSELKQYKKQMAIFEMLYEKNELTRGNQLLNLANLYLLHDVPYKAARVIDNGMKQGVIKKEVKNLRLLSQAWLQAQESEKSIPPLKEAAGISKDGDLNVRLAQAYINLDRYKEAVSALEAGFKKGGIKREDQAYTMLGLANFELERFNSSLKAFVNAKNDARKNKRTTRSIDQWITYVNSERDRKKQIEESLKRRRRS